MVTIYVITYNEELMIEYFIQHYKKRFPNCRIVVYDNYSTDKTVEIAKRNSCEIVMYDTNNKLSDSKYLEIKNNCWKDATTDWVLVCDIDEMVDISQDNLHDEEMKGVSIISTKGYNMHNISNEEGVENSIFGVRAKQYDKYYLFNRKYISDINFSPGCHYATPIGSVFFSEKRYFVYHYYFIGLNYVIEKYKRNAERLSDENIRNGWGFHYRDSESQIRDKYMVAKNYFEKHKENINEEEAIICKNF